MLEFYDIYYVLKNVNESVELMRSYGGCKCCRGEPERQETLVTWDNAAEEINHIRFASVELKQRRRGRVLTFSRWLYNEEGYTFKEWERPELDLVLIKEYEPTKKSIQEVLEYRDGNIAIEYLLERGINYLGK